MDVVTATMAHLCIQVSTLTMLGIAKIAHFCIQVSTLTMLGISRRQGGSGWVFFHKNLGCVVCLSDLVLAFYVLCFSPKLLRSWVLV